MIRVTTQSGTEYLINVELMQFRRHPDPRSERYQALPKDGYMEQYDALYHRGLIADDEECITVGDTLIIYPSTQREDVGSIRTTPIVSIDVLGGH